MVNVALIKVDNWLRSSKLSLITPNQQINETVTVTTRFFRYPDCKVSLCYVFYE